MKKTAPCRECPFRKRSAAGWIGSHRDPSEITNIVMSERKFPCHMEVNELMDGGHDFVDAASSADHCRGGLAMMNNCLKLARDSHLAALQRKVGKREDVFSHPQQMIDHHRSAEYGIELRKPRRARP